MSQNSLQSSSYDNQFNPLVHEFGKETKILVKKAEEVNDKDFFYYQYKKALAMTSSIANNQQNDVDDYDNIENFNNIITFIGDRGSGKTSCMLTFANLLKDPHRNEVSQNVAMSGNSFYVLPTIDPSFFVSAYNIIGAFIARIYNKFNDVQKERQNKGYNENDEGKIQDFYKALSDAQKSFGRLYSEKKDDMDDMERLEQLSCSMRLKKEIYDLVNSFLCCMGGKTKLVICIDDIDLNTKTAVDILEWIRKYLIQPNIIILFAIKLDQMYDLKRMSLYTEYKELLAKEKISDAEIDEMTEKYITKLFPLAQRVYLPNAENVPRLKYQYYCKDKNGEKKLSDQKEIRDIVVEEIYNKTQFLFYNYDLQTNLIVPDNVRDVLYLMRLLNEMKMVSDEDKEILKRNQQIFKDYFFNNWINKNLDYESREQIYDILKNPDTDQLNGRILWMVKNRCQTILEYKKFEEFNKEYNDSVLKEISYVLNDRNNTYNISMGDTMWIVNWLYNMVRSREETYFLFAVKTIYSMKLLECYDKMVNQELEPQKYKLNTNKNHLQPTDNLKNKLDYHLLLNGQFFNQILSCFYIAEKGKNEEITLKNKWIDVEKFSDALNAYKSNEEKPSTEDIDKGKLYEFIMLCISIHNSGNKTNDDSLYRMKPHARYSLPIGLRRKYVKFDVCAFFYNITDIKSCYNRFKPLFNSNEAFEKFINRKYALWREFVYVSEKATCGAKRLKDVIIECDDFDVKTKNINYVPDYFEGKDLENLYNKDWRKWLSWVCVQNVEVYQNFIENMESRRERTSSLCIVETLITVFKNISGYHLRTYKDGEEEYSINFSYAYIIVNLLLNLCNGCKIFDGCQGCNKYKKCAECKRCQKEKGCETCSECNEKVGCTKESKGIDVECSINLLYGLLSELPDKTKEEEKEYKITENDAIQLSEIEIKDGNKTRHYKK